MENDEINLYIDKYKRNGLYYTSDGCEYDVLDFLQLGILGFCPCGRPNQNLIYVYRALCQIKKLEDDTYDSITWQKENIELFGNEQSMFFMWYYLDSKRYTEHGGSVPGWLTEEGDKLLSDLDILIKKGVLDENCI